MHLHMRIARPVADIARSQAMYCKGLGLHITGSFRDHDGFDGVMLGGQDLDYHFEFTRCRTHPVAPSPTPEDLVVFYLPDPADWQAACERMLGAGFREAEPFNPYWRQRGRAFEDADGYRVVLQNEAWPAQPAT